MLSLQWSVLVVGLLAAALFFPIIPAFAVTCVELGSCVVSSNPLEWMIEPFTYLVGDWIFVLMWGMVLGVVYIRTGNAMLTALAGFVVFAGFIGSSALLGSATSQLFYWGIVLVGIAIGITVFYLIWVKLRNPT